MGKAGAAAADGTAPGSRACGWWCGVIVVTVFGSLLGVFLAALGATLSSGDNRPTTYTSIHLVAPLNNALNAYSQPPILGIEGVPVQPSHAGGASRDPSLTSLHNANAVPGGDGSQQQQMLNNMTAQKMDASKINNIYNRNPDSIDGAADADWASGLCGRISTDTLAHLQAGNFEAALRAGPFKVHASILSSLPNSLHTPSQTRR